MRVFWAVLPLARLILSAMFQHSEYVRVQMLITQRSAGSYFFKHPLLRLSTLAVMRPHLEWGHVTPLSYACLKSFFFQGAIRGLYWSRHRLSHSLVGRCQLLLALALYLHRRAVLVKLGLPGCLIVTSVGLTELGVALDIIRVASE